MPPTTYNAQESLPLLKSCRMILIYESHSEAQRRENHNFLLGNESNLSVIFLKDVLFLFLSPYITID